MWSPPSWVCNQHDLSLLIGQRPNKKRAITEPERQKWVIHRNPLCNGLTQNPKPRRRRLLSSIIPQVYGRKAKRKRRWHKTWTSIIHRVLHHRPNACFSQKDHTFSSDITSSPLNYVSEAWIAAFNEYSRYAYVPNGFFCQVSDIPLHHTSTSDRFYVPLLRGDASPVLYTDPPPRRLPWWFDFDRHLGIKMTIFWFFNISSLRTLNPCALPSTCPHTENLSRRGVHPSLV